ncbi:sigma-54-dependent Fis family transcriptional regulator [Natronospirillum operosum]|uniref:Sigma-54-dependent Fis family transcriptional regulator n=1 Tax=Natronospirillum operosum TaxID=2759953 RepID=A0A4Z0WAE1_9GAMM|nr:sigma 54-interacting transcriptional regulator [Natronospirillum operosum]TGG93335.1 sigma-54-dependent Fis family transcriptional regulator [Natronospirillum operosum]
MTSLTRTEPAAYGRLLTTAPNMHAFMAQAERVARTEASILVRGQTGSGKELVARYIHDQSRRAHGPFHAINCAALSRELMASELFGHKRGAFTGATQDRIGLLALTDGGTLFLDEIAEMPMDIQAGLLRVLQDRCFTPLGSSEVVHTDIRLVSATHESLRRLVAEGRFREDLMYRIRVVPLYLPPLRERPGDVEMLLGHHLQRLNASNERQVRHIAPEALEALLTYRWPGNVRELDNVMTYAHAIGEGETIALIDLPPELRGEAPPDEAWNPVEEAEREQILALLQQHGGQRQVVADALGISRATLWRRMKTLGLQ